MTNNDDFDQPDYNPTEELAPPKSNARANLAEAWRTRPLFKLVVLMTAVAAIVAAGVSFFGGSSATKNASRLPNPPSISSAPGGPTSPYMASETDLANRNREQQALESGGSAMPTPIGRSTDMGALSTNDPKKNDPLNELKAEIERLRQDQKQTQQQQVQQQQQLQQGGPQKAQQQQQEQFDDSLATAMQRQMTQLMDSWTPPGVKEVLVKSDEKNGKGATGASGSTSTAASTTTNPAPPAKTILSAGTVSYAQLLTEANSDVPGPILAQIVSGPFSGARAVGQFQVANGYADYLVLQFTLVNFKGKDYPISAIALDPNTTLGGMATEVDQRYFTRVVLPAAAGFLQGFGQALGTGNSSTVTNGTSTIVQQSQEGYRQGLFQGLGQGAQTMSQFFQNQANLIKPLVRVAAGTPMGIFFVTSVQDQTVQQLQQQQSQNGYNPAMGISGIGGSYPGLSGYNGLGATGANPYMAGAYPGTNVTGYGAPATTPNVPYPNYANPVNTASPYSAFPTQGVPGLGTTYYTH